MISNRNWLTTEETAKYLGVTPAYVRELLNRGQYDSSIKLKGTKCGKEWRIDRNSVNDYLGISIDENNYKKDLYIKELEGKVQLYKTKLQAFEALAITLQGLIGNDMNRV
ncbi:helix-turn-helix domain-containing protein [Clostridium saudiense]|uniref:helix-turn-helix domain-containing protein n=1 Tax=Clostridium saudiense TaxID=1414720 RepID=UPI0018ABA50F|nr:helix-turn-helix domain-containing protein [Clostridium saudiense]